ncbi:hypothetical protein TNCV_4499651 [Trichonephila clavipes]|nr:hypothetical protein TNCV_4499651 [Trichonephila clavipes]
MRGGRSLTLPQGQNWGGTELNRTVTCIVLKATANDRRTPSPLAMMNFVGLDLTTTQGHETTPPRVKEDEDGSSELGNGGYRLQFLDETFRTLFSASGSNKTSSRLMTTIKCIQERIA